MYLFYSSTLTTTSHTFTFSREESKHIAKVLRKKEGDVLHITNGKGLLCTAKITLAHPTQCIVAIQQSEMQPKKPYRLHMAVAPTKMNDRYEWFLEKATEIGVDEITPIICDHSERKVIKLERFERILQSAMKQSLQCYLPQLNPTISLTEFLQHSNSDQLFIAHCEDSDKQSLKSVLNQATSTTLLIGPEGDFSRAEIELALAQGYRPITLGDNRLRTETAAIAAVHSIAFMNS